MTTDDLLAKLRGVKRASSGWTARCPAHEDQHASLSISTGEDGRILLRCHAGCSTEAVVTTLGLKLAELFTPRSGNGPDQRPRIVATSDYTDEQGQLLFQCVRYCPKDFKQRRPDPARPGEWIWNLNGVRRVLYHLREVVGAVRRAGRSWLPRARRT
jgi:hypothetical protein